MSFPVNNDPVSDYYEGLPDGYPKMLEAVTLLEEIIEEEREAGNCQRVNQLEDALDIIDGRFEQKA